MKKMKSTASVGTDATIFYRTNQTQCSLLL